MVQLPGGVPGGVLGGLDSLDAGQIRRYATASVSWACCLHELVRFGDDLAQAWRNVMAASSGSVYRLNPGLQAASLVTALQIRVANSSPAQPMVLDCNLSLAWSELA